MGSGASGTAPVVSCTLLDPLTRRLGQPWFRLLESRPASYVRSWSADFRLSKNCRTQAISLWRASVALQPPTSPSSDETWRLRVDLVVTVGEIAASAAGDLAHSTGAALVRSTGAGTEHYRAGPIRPIGVAAGRPRLSSSVPVASASDRDFGGVMPTMCWMGRSVGLGSGFVRSRRCPVVPISAQLMGPEPLAERCLDEVQASAPGSIGVARRSRCKPQLVARLDAGTAGNCRLVVCGFRHERTSGLTRLRRQR